MWEIFKDLNRAGDFLAGRGAGGTEGNVRKHLRRVFTVGGGLHVDERRVKGNVNPGGFFNASSTRFSVLASLPLFNAT